MPGIITNFDSSVYSKVRWNVTNCEGVVYYKVRWNYYKLRQLFNYKSRHGLLQSEMIITDCLSTVYSDTLQFKRRS